MVWDSDPRDRRFAIGRSAPLHVAETLDDLAVPDTHNVDASDPVRLTLAPAKLPADDPAIAHRGDFLSFEDKVGGRRHSLPESEASLTPFVARSILPNISSLLQHSYNRARARNAEDVDECIQHTLDGFSAGPALFISPCCDVLAYNRLANRVAEFDDGNGPFGRNHIWRFFMDPKRRAKYLNWEALAEASVRELRAIYGKMLDNAYFISLVRELCDGSSVFRRLWDAQLTAHLLESLNIEMKLPPFGAVYFTSVRFRPLNSQQLLVLLSPADEQTVKVMRKLSAGKPANPRKNEASL